MTVGRCVASDAGPPLTTDVPRLGDDRPAPLPDVFDAGLHASDVVDVEAQPDVPVLADFVDVVVPPDAMAALDVSTAPPDAGCGPEVCNGVDDDCDGVIDNLLPTACTFGPCATGMRRCPMGLEPGTRFVESTPAVCERDAFAPTSTVCRPAAGACDVAENCTGVDAECPPDRFASAGEVCRASTSVEACDPAERCTGVSGACPADRVTSTPGVEVCNNLDDDCDGRVDNGATCPVGQVCLAGACASLSPDGVVDPDTMASGITLLRDPRDGGLVVVYGDEGRNEVRTAHFNGRWTLATAFRGMRIQKEGADLDASGVVHAVFNDPANTALHYANNRGGTWSSPNVIPGMPGNNGTMDLDTVGAVHVVSNEHLRVRRYTSNASGAWSSPVQVTSSGTAPAAVVASGVSVPAVAHAVWNARRIDFGDAPGFVASTLSGYGVDQGPPMSMVARNGTLALAYVLTTDAYTNYSVYFQQRPAGGSWSSRTEIIGRVRGIGPVEVSLDGSGARFVTFCTSAGEVRTATDRGGSWRVSPLVVTAPCLGAMDALIVGGRIHLAYRSTGGQLRVATFETTGL